MTNLKRPVRRVVPPTRPSDRGYVVTMSPPNLLEIREKGRRKSYTIALGGLYVMLAQREVDNARARRRPRARRGKP